MSNHALLTLRPSTIALIKAFNQRRAELFGTQVDRKLLAMGRQVFRNSYPRQWRVKIVSGYSVGCH